MNVPDVVRATAFGTCITLTSVVTRAAGGQITRASDRPKNPLQPPGWVFVVVWPALYVTTGAAWVLGRSDTALSVVTALCCAWLVVYTILQWRRTASFVLMATVVAATFAAVESRGTAGWLLSPLVAWTAFASYLSYS